MISGLCTPAKLYGIISLVSVAGLLVNQQVAEALGQTIFAGIWIFVLNWICSEGWTGLSWFLVILPVIAVILVIVGGAAAVIANPALIQQLQQQEQMSRRG